MAAARVVEDQRSETESATADETDWFLLYLQQTPGLSATLLNFYAKCTPPAFSPTQVRTNKP